MEFTDASGEVDYRSGDLDEWKIRLATSILLLAEWSGEVTATGIEAAASESTSPPEESSSRLPYSCSPKGSAMSVGQEASPLLQQSTSPKD